MTVGELLDAANSFPFHPLREKLENRPFIVVAPHPDDESLACGGLIADGCRQELPGKVVIVSDGAGSHPKSKAYPPDRLTALRNYLNPDDVGRLAARVTHSLAKGGAVILVHWTGPTNYPLSGDEAAALFIERMGSICLVERADRHPEFRLDVLSRA
jgi:GlcNAc-PI de-N-acetylase